MGHALDETLQDILIRYKRMQGYAALWLPGTDHASIATCRLYTSDKSRGILLGDSLSSDMAGGANAGIDTCWYHPEGDVSSAEYSAGITFKIRKLSEFIPIVIGK